jgi:hypothetical protein
MIDIRTRRGVSATKFNSLLFAAILLTFGNRPTVAVKTVDDFLHGR